ncbi:MAG: endo alpha-1,4 polygalactosaminidase [Hyphomicrobiaceae bacterium]
MVYRIAFPLLLLIAACCGAASAQSPRPQPAAARPASDKAITGIKSWGYQLQKINPAEIAASPFDLVVIDYSRTGVEAGRFSKAEVAAMQRKPDGQRRLVLAYLSIGEAESYRYYWDRKWVEPAPFRQSTTPPPISGLTEPVAAPLPKTVLVPKIMAPSWLGRENENWPGNFHVRYWYEEWQSIIVHDARSYLQRIQDAGFDGVYLDRVDAYYALGEDRPFATQGMVDFVVDLATAARKRHPEFLVVAQNAEELLRNPRYLNVINAIAKEDLLFGNPGEGLPNEAEQIGVVIENLMLAQAAGLPVMVIEYLDAEATVKAALETLRGRGFLPYFGPRKLNRLVVPRPEKG